MQKSQTVCPNIPYVRTGDSLRAKTPQTKQTNASVF